MMLQVAESYFYKGAWSPAVWSFVGHGRPVRGSRHSGNSFSRAGDVLDGEMPTSSLHDTCLLLEERGSWR